MTARFGILLTDCWIAALTLAVGPSLAQEDQGNRGPTYHLSNDGEATLLVKTPDYYSVPNTGQHIGIVPYKTRVEVLETKQDASLRILSWSRVRVLEGQFKGKEGWVSSRTVVKTAQQALSPALKPSRLARQKSDADSPETKTASSSSASRCRVVTPTILRSQPAATGGASLGQLTKGTHLERLDESSEDEALFVTAKWYKVRVADGPLKAKTGFVLGHHIHCELPKLPYDSAKAFAYAKKYCKGGNDCPTGEYGSFSNPLTLLTHVTSTDCTHFQSHILRAGGVEVKGKGASCESSLEVRLEDLYGWFRDATSRYANVTRIDRWQDARRGDYCFEFAVGHHAMLLNGPPDKNGAPVYGHANNRCGERVAFPVSKCVFFRIEDHPNQTSAVEQESPTP